MDLSWLPAPENVTRALVLLAAGMVGILTVMLFLMGTVALLNYLTRRRDKKE